MVKNTVLSEYSSDPPEGSGRVKIATERGQPLYSLERVHAIVADEQGLVLWTRKCQQDVHKLFDSDLERVAALIQALRKDVYIDSEWCENGHGGWAACDAYRIRRQEIREVSDQSVTVEYFVKFAVSKSGQLVLLVSCHL